jgi:hypothetical protein
MSVESPTRWNTSKCSTSGVSTSPKPPRRACSANVATSSDQRADSGARTSRIPRGAWNSGTADEAICAMVGPTWRRTRFGYPRSASARSCNASVSAVTPPIRRAAFSGCTPAALSFPLAASFSAVVAMAEGLLTGGAGGQEPSLFQLAQHTELDQQVEIARMKQLLTELDAD